MELTNAKKVAKFGRQLGIRLLSQDPILGLKRILLPVEYIRYAENEYVMKQLDLKGWMRILDIGSPKLLGLYIGTIVEACHLTDISDYFLKNSIKEISALRMQRSAVELQDARDLGYCDKYFDGIYSISVIEHIPDKGDTEALIEMSRVLKPGGRLCVTVPHDDGGYREIYKKTGDSDAYWVESSGAGSIFYQRIYDSNSLNERLVKPIDLRLIDITYYGETEFAAERFLLNRTKLLKVCLFPFHGFLAGIFLRKIEVNAESFKKVACLTFEKE